ncbi:hypothetical protein [Kitasatospora sp. NPDC056731]|uniref:hypothetical protein n=1 Tax=Kitasatospora sp. NPDC056731 TaxID=3155422 RepID=UPI0034318F94
MTDLPHTTAAGHRQLKRLADAEDADQHVYVYRDPGYPSRPGAGISRPTLDRLLADKLVRLDDYQPLRGRPVLVTDLGRSVLAADRPNPRSAP